MDQENIEPLLHYSAKPFVFDSTWRYKSDRFKPVGLWVSSGTSWADWCKEQDFNLNGITHVCEIVLAKDANILHLKTPGAIEQFTSMYASTGRFGSMYIDWGRLQKYQGIIIAPYQWSLRLAPHTSWYYPWDCASGCIWDLSAIKTVAPMVHLGRAHETVVHRP